ncbi:hypothetical protein LXA43DRAFT_146924 [Ganoderma leucocontextum]|nr:hypothetical protein LXA43DRAFT_210866 [Ganoderma leucocontextum]KAI1785258.1 hypothetical protein LXA43DRAFT_146924 [Ganoderma leucocontextum]
MPAPFLALAGWHDTFHEILNHLEPTDTDDNDDYDGKIFVAARRAFRRTLLSLALSCHALLDPSLDKLWNNLDDIHPLLKLLPNYQRRNSIHHLTGEITPEAWSRLQTYARRVRGITLGQEASIDALVWPTILNQCQGTLLFPNLQTLSMRMWNATHASFTPIHALASPSLRYLSLSVDTEGADKASIATITGAMLQEFSMKSPGLIRLSFFPYMTIGPEHLMCLSRFTHMERLNISDYSTIDEGVLLTLTNLGNLTHLQASVLLRDSTESALLGLKDGFQNLTKLELCCQPAHLTRFMLASPMPRLKDLCLQLASHSADGFETSLASICRHLRPPTLTRFRAELDNFRRPPRFLINLLEPLLPFVNLEELEFFFEEHLPLRNEDLERFSHAWPKLRALILIQGETTLSTPNRMPGSVERPTLHGLVELARRCPQLDRLCIPDLDASRPPQADSVPLMGHGPLDLCIQNLVGAGVDETQLRVAVVLDRLFPCLKLESGIEELLGYGDTPNPYTEDSENVSLLLRAMQIARKHYPGGVECVERPVSS